MSKRNYRYRIEIKFVKAFIDCPYPKFIRYLDLEMDVDYLVGLCIRFIKKDKHLDNRLSFLTYSERNKIEDYLQSQGDEDDRIFYFFMLSAQNILEKYYDTEGKWKREVGPSVNY